MSQNILFNGLVYTIPDVGDEGWGDNVTSYLVAIPQGALQKTGGVFTLTADVNFGATFGLMAAYYKTRVSNPSTAGLLRLAVTDSIGWRNNAFGGNLLLAVNGSDELTFNGNVVPVTPSTLTASCMVFTNASSQLATDSQLTYDSINHLQIWSATAADSGGGIRIGASSVPGGNTPPIYISQAAGVPNWTNHRYGAAPGLNFRSAAGTRASPTHTTSGSSLCGITMGGYYDNASPSFGGNSILIQGLATQDYTNAAQGSKLQFSTTPNNSTTNAVVLTLDQDASAAFTGAVSIVGAVTLTSLSISQLVATNGSKVLTSVVYTNLNTASAVVQRDGSGNFSAGTITASLTGHASLDVATSSLGNLTDAGTDGITVTGGTGSVVGSVSLAQHVADTTHNGYLSSTDWNTFNGKQAAGNYITALTGDGSASGPGSAALTLATVNTNVGSFGSASSVAVFTVNGKGLITAASSTAISISLTANVTGILPIANGGSNNSTFDSGAVLFFDGTRFNDDSHITLDSTNHILNFDATASDVSGGGGVRIGASTVPGSATANLYVSSNSSNSSAIFDRYGASPSLILRRADGTRASPTKTVSGDTLGAIAFRGYQQTSNAFTTVNNGLIQAITTEDFTSTANGTKLVFSTTPNGSTTTTTALTLGQDQSATFAGNVSLGFTAGSIVFSDGSKLTQDNSKLFWDDSNVTLAIGTAAPTFTGGLLYLNTNSETGAAGTAAIMIAGDANKERIELRSISSPCFQASHCNNTVASPTAAVSGNSLLFLQAGGYDGSNFKVASARITMLADQDWTTTHYGTAMTFSTTPNNSTTLTERMRIDNAGFLYLNTTTQRNSAFQSIDFSGTGATQTGIGINDTSSVNASAFIGFLTGGSLRGSITNNNNTGVLYNVTSDYRLKQNINTMRDGLSKIICLNPVYFTWKETGLPDEGFIAHEVSTLFPHAVVGSKDQVNDKDEPIYQQMDSKYIIPSLVSAIKELKHEIDLLKSQMRAQ